ncbi:MAG: nucleotidyl transferase AbiEii/AbiGii toxin family protein [Acidimicrobiales bacterium]
MSIPASQRHLFKLDWVRNPALLAEQQRVTGITSQYTAEIAAWCVELHQQLQELAHEMGLHLLLMGGNGAALRMDLSSLRGSADNDYLTSASPRDLQALLDALARRFSGMPDGLLQPQRIPKPEGAEELPMLAYRVAVPKLFDPNPTIDALTVKLEFHLDDELPPSDTITVAHGFVGQSLTAHVPQLPYQVALKLLALVEPPVGIDADREPAVARQIYDIDVLLAAMLQPTDWDALRTYAPHRYAKEIAQRGLSPTQDEPWSGARWRLQEWSACIDGDTRFWRHINAMQSSQLARSSKSTPEEWAARCHRLIVATRCSQDAKPNEPWQRALSIEALIPPKPHGPELRALRRAIRRVAKAPIGHPRAGFWGVLAQAEDSRDLLARLDALDRTLADI